MLLIQPIAATVNKDGSECVSFIHTLSLVSTRMDIFNHENSQGTNQLPMST